MQHPKADVVLHSDPAETKPNELAILLAVLANVYEVGYKIPDTTWPIRVSICIGNGKDIPKFNNRPTAYPASCSISNQ